MDFKFIENTLEINRIIHNTEDFADLYFYKIIPIIFLILSIITFSKDCFFDPIVCWIPKYWSPAFDKYTRAICWSDSTYIIKERYNITSKRFEISQIKQNYYQWISLFLLALGVLLILPHKLWQFYCHFHILNLNQIEKINFNFKSLNTKFHEKTLDFIIKMFETVINENRKRTISQTKCPTNNTLLYLFIFLKLVYLALALMEIYFIQKILGFESIHFGLELLKTYHFGSTWKDTGIFPVITWCNVPIKEEGDEYFKNVQCILPYNVFNDKMFIGIWLILIIGLILLTLNLLSWFIILGRPTNHDNFIHRHIYYTFVKEQKIEMKEVKKFNKDFLGKNGIFLLYFLFKHTSEDGLHKIIRRLWMEWKKFEMETENSALV